MTMQQAEPTTSATPGPMVMGVDGPIRAEDLGSVLIHEHVFIDLVEAAYAGTSAARQPEEEDVSLQSLSWLRYDWTSSRDNLRLDSVDVAIAEVKRFGEAGGATIVSATPNDLDPRPVDLRTVSRATGVNIVVGTGFYTANIHPHPFRSSDIPSLRDRFIGDLIEGRDGVRSGVIGEIGCSWPLDPSESTVLDAAVLAHRATDAPMIVHCGRNPRAPVDLADQVVKGGADPGSVVLAHLDRTDVPDDQLVSLAKRGLYLAFDLFGLETSYYPPNPETLLPNDGTRIQTIVRLLDAGVGDRFLISQDICTKHRLATYGGHGYDHILRRVVPQMLQAGIPQAVIDGLLIGNPRRWLARGD